jgi:hypothetical protein
MNQVYEPLKDPATDGYTFVGVAVDPAIEQALAPNWKEPLWAKFKSYAIGFGAAVFLIALLLSVLYLWKKTDASPQTEPVTMTIEPIPQVADKSTVQKRVKAATENVAAKAINTKAAPTVKESLTVEKTEPLTDFDRDLINFERQIP